VPFGVLLHAAKFNKWKKSGCILVFFHIFLLKAPAEQLSLISSGFFYSSRLAGWIFRGS